MFGKCEKEIGGSKSLTLEFYLRNGQKCVVKILLYFDGSDKWSDQWDKLILRKNADIKYVIAGEFDSIYTHILNYEKSLSSVFPISESNANELIELLRSVGGEFEKIEHYTSWDKEKLQAAEDKPFVKIYIVVNDEIKTPKNSASDFFPDESNSGFLYGLKIAVASDGHVYIDTRFNELYKSAKTVDYQKIKALVPNG